MEDLKVGTLALPDNYYNTIRTPKLVARITICGAVSCIIDDTMAFTKPTPEQIQNLKETFCIDVELFDKE